MNTIPKVRVLFAMTGNVFRNTRALRQINTLKTGGFSVQVLCLAGEGEASDLEGVEVRQLSKPRGTGPKLFWRLDRLFSRNVFAYSADVYHASDLYVLPALRKKAHKEGAKLVYDARERYPYVASTAGRPWVSRFWFELEKFNIKHADAVFTVSDGIARHMVQTLGIKRPCVSPNAPEVQKVIPSTFLRDKLNVDADTVIVLHQGQMRKARGCEKLVTAFKNISRAVLVFMGDGPEKRALQKMTERLGISGKVRFLEPVPPGKLLPITGSADIGVTLLEDTCLNHRFALPNKLFEYLMAGLPVIGSNLPEIRSVIEGFDVGVVVDPDDGVTLTDALQQMIDSPGKRQLWRNHIPRVFETFGWEKASRGFLSTYRTLITGVDS